MLNLNKRYIKEEKVKYKYRLDTDINNLTVLTTTRRELCQIPKVI